ncbi:MAG: GNAT family N-acetyltransferase [Bacillota bacterium]
MDTTILRKTGNPQALNSFFRENGLETADDDNPAGAVTAAWKLNDAGSGQLIGAVVLVRRNNEYIINDIAVDPLYRNNKYGMKLLKKAIAEVNRLAGKRIYLVAKVPPFFATAGFREWADKEALQLFSCIDCPQYKKTCHPKVMRLDLKE